MSASLDPLLALVCDALDEATAPRRLSPDPVAVVTDELLATCGRVGPEDLGEKWRWRSHDAARQAAVYLAFLQPPAGWIRETIADLREPDLPATFLWRRDDVLVADVLTVAARGAQLWKPHTTGLPRRIIRDGRIHLDGHFVGVRLLSLRAPGASLFVPEPTGSPVPLRTTPWWFHDVAPEGAELVAAVAGEVVS